MKTRIPAVLITFFVVAFALVQNTEAVSPAPDGGYPAANTAEGDDALFSLAVGLGNTASGLSALQGNITGDRNTAIGYGALIVNTTGIGNTASGVGALQENTTGAENTANGAAALRSNTTGSDNIALKFLAGQNVTTGSGNVYVGTGMDGVAGEANHTYIRNVKDTTVSGSGTDTVTVDLSTGLLGHLTSSRRYKENIKPMDKASEALFALKPVTYRYKKQIDPSRSPAFGLIAEEVAQVNSDLVARNSKGQPESVHYEMVNAMLLNEFLKEHRTVQELRKQIAALTATVKEQAAQIQKVSAQLEVSKPAPRLVTCY
jgi:hypothetical protein